jgi:hypothetical protein
MGLDNLYQRGMVALCDLWRENHTADKPARRPFDHPQIPTIQRQIGLIVELVEV